MVDSFAATAGPHLVKELDMIAAQWAVGSGVNDTSVRALLERRVDFMITSDDTFRQHDLIALPVFEEPYVIVAPASVEVSRKTLDALRADMALIRYSPRSFIGRQIDDYLLRRSLNIQHRYELDTSDAVMAMVSAGVGWTITTPLVALKSKPSAKQVRFYPLSGLRLKRVLTLLARKSESAELAELIASTARDALIRLCLPDMLKLAPWLGEHFQKKAA